MPEVLGTGCNSAAGVGVAAFWECLKKGDKNSQKLTPSWVKSLSLVYFPWKTSLEGKSFREILTAHLLEAWVEVMAGLSIPVSGNLGVILASTKGCIDDLIWNIPGGKIPEQDPLTPVLESFLAESRLKPLRKICVSNACASSHYALKMASHWLEQKEIDQVLVLASEAVGPFVAHGFQSLRALSPELLRPFDQNRSGLQLGEAAAAILLGKKSRTPAALSIRSVGIDTEGHAVTRPSENGDSLRRACERALNEGADEIPISPDLIIAHGTATPINDRIEDRALSHLMKNKSIPVTATKWCIGHTLGASGAMDVIAACEALKHQQAFRIATTAQPDQELKCSYLFADFPLKENMHLENILVTSLGFGGTHAAAIVGKTVGVT